MAWQKVLEVWISGNPRTKGSFVPIKRKDGGVFLKQDPKSKSWENTIRELCQDKLEDPPTYEPVALELRFLFPRPNNHYQGNDPARALRPNAPRHCSSGRGNDIDKLIRAVLDGLSQVLYQDDKQVVEVLATKRYCEDPDRGGGLWLVGLVLAQNTL